MIRTEIYLTDEQKKALSTLAYAESTKSNKRISMANIIRDAINLYLEKNGDYPLIKEAALLGQSPGLKRIVEKSVKQIKQGKSRLAREFLNELPD
jgi:hypothetical protein